MLYRQFAQRTEQFTLKFQMTRCFRPPVTERERQLALSLFRVVDEIDELGYGDNTLIFYIWGDNGSSAEGQGGTISELLAQNGLPTTVKQHIAALG